MKLGWGLFCATKEVCFSPLLSNKWCIQWSPSFLWCQLFKHFVTILLVYFTVHTTLVTRFISSLQQSPFSLEVVCWFVLKLFWKKESSNDDYTRTNNCNLQVSVISKQPFPFESKATMFAPIPLGYILMAVSLWFTKLWKWKTNPLLLL